MLRGKTGLVGMITLGDGWIEQLYVHPEHFGQRTGTELIGHAKKLFPGGLDLWTFQSNTRARGFYEGQGFVPVGETSGANEERAPDIHCHWDG